ncbi:BURP domain protein RD22 [Primulina tabacum]|uniref:BURP domain protein RD22 n=1 Tax=Primulina tabacum TaxID=48773 RepID=UPI003F59793E
MQTAFIFSVMEFKKFYQILAFLSVAWVASHAALPSEAYWNSMLPNSPMPKAVKDLLQPAELLVEDKSTRVGVSKGGVNVNTGTSKKGGTSVNVGHGSVGVHTGKPGGRTNVGVGRGGVTVGTGTKKGKPVYVGVHPGSNPFNYLYAATQTQLHDNPNVALFFLPKDLSIGKNMNLNFFQTKNQATFLPRKVADSIPFSTNKLPEIFSKFSVDPSSNEAEMIRKTIEECEDTTEINGEEKFCATSLESMIDFSTSKIGKNVEAISTNAESESTLKYSIVGVKKLPSEKAVVVCHRQEYAYAVFYCHETETTVSYQVLMVGADGSKAEAVAVCHKDTAAWNPKHLAFQVLKVRPGSVPVCHFLPQDHVVWVPKN